MKKLNVGKELVKRTKRFNEILENQPEPKAKLDAGDFAICQKGELGLILWKKTCIEKRTNKKYFLYYGINLNSGKLGLNWQSKNPTKVNKNYVKNQFKGV